MDVHLVPGHRQDVGRHARQVDHRVVPRFPTPDCTCSRPSGRIVIRPSKPIDPAAGGPTTLGLIGHFFTTLFWTLSNPVTILTFIAIFTGVDVAGPGGQIGSPEREFVGITALVAGVALGATAWWLLLTQGVGMFRHHFFGGGQTTRWPNFIAGTLIIIFGLYALTAVFRLF